MRRLASRDEGGAIAIIVAAASVLLFVLAALVVDLGFARDTRRQSQNAADASALAAANRLYSSGAVDLAAAASAAQSYASTNFSVPSAAWASCTDPSHLAVVSAASACISFDNAAAPTRVRVVMPSRRVDTPFGTVAGTDHVDVGSYAEAVLAGSPGGPCGFCLLGEALHDFGTTNLYANGTSVMMNGSLCAKKDFQVTPSPPNTLSIEDGVKTTTGCKSSGVLPYPVTTGATLTDPLASLAMPSTAGFSVKNALNPCGGSGGPGIYSTFNGISGTTCTLSPGLYVITGATHLTGIHTINGTGVTLYFVCGSPTAIVACTATNSNDFDMFDQNVHLNLVAAVAATATNRAVPGVAILADRGWTGDMSFQGGGGGGVTQGAIYLKSGTIHYGGNSDGKVLDSMIVVDDFAGNGHSATLDVTNTGTNVPDTGPKSPSLIK